MNTNDSHMGGFASALVMLAAIATTFVTYGYYKDDELASRYENDQAVLEQTASALVSLRLQEEVLMTQSTSTETEEVSAPELE